MAATVPAVVAYPPNPGPNWRYEEIKVTRNVRPDELLVRMVATGICHTDVYVASIPNNVFGVQYPKILGHEGAGYVEDVGSSVTVAKIGDRVLLSYDSCQNCDLCRTARPSYCTEFTLLNITGQPGTFATRDDTVAHGKFFGQSSFSSLTIVNEASVVNVQGTIKNDEELKLLAPLGCGLQTGAGAVTLSGNAGPTDRVIVFGLGGVGLGAIMAAKIAGCQAVIGVDRIPSRLEVARSLGTTHVLDASKSSTIMVDDIAKLVDNARISIAIETTGVTNVMQTAMTCLGKRGKFIQIGVPDQTGSLTVQIGDFYNNAKILEGNFMGNSVSKDFVPKMIRWYHDGNFPVERLVKFFPAKDVAEALHGMEDGSVIKPVLIW